MSESPQVTDNKLMAASNLASAETWGHKWASERAKFEAERWELLSVKSIKSVPVASYEGKICKIRVEDPIIPSEKEPVPLER